LCNAYFVLPLPASADSAVFCCRTETVLALLRHPEYCQYGAASTKGVRGLDAAEERFNEVRTPCLATFICCFALEC
jgi:uncharacterized membrane protein